MSLNPGGKGGSSQGSVLWKSQSANGFGNDEVISLGHEAVKGSKTRILVT